MIFAVMRHGDTKIDLEGKSQGMKTSGLMMSSRSDIRQKAKELKGKIDVIVCSDAERAYQTAKIVSEETGAKVVDVNVLARPWDYGDLVGEDEDKILELLNDYFTENEEEVIPNGESFKEFKDRFLDFVEGTLSAYQGKTVLFVTHSCNERLLRAWNKKGQKRREIDKKENKKKGIKSGEYEFLGNDFIPKTIKCCKE